MFLHRVVGSYLDMSFEKELWKFFNSLLQHMPYLQRNLKR
jgi:hypothetical protein